MRALFSGQYDIDMYVHCHKLNGKFSQEERMLHISVNTV